MLDAKSDTRSARRSTVAACAAVTLLLAGCEGTVTTDLAVEPPADPGVQQVLVRITGLEFIGSDGTSETFEFGEPESVVLTNHANGSTLRLSTDEELPEGSYTGVRLLFDDENEDSGSLIAATGAQFPIIANEGDYAAIDVKIADDDNSSDSLTLTIDLRQSLTFVDDDDRYTLTPVLRAVPTDEAGQVQGAVDTVCSSTGLDTVAAVYLFQGSDISPDDRDGSGVEPYATTPVVLNANGTFSYAFRFLPAGDYTIAVACKGNQEDPSTDDALDFKDTANVSVEEGATSSHDM